MNDSFLMRVLNRMANLDEKIEPLLCCERIAIAVFRDFDTSNEFHHEVGPARIGRSCVEHFRDVRITKERDRFSRGSKSGEDTFGLQAGFDNLESTPPTNRMFLLRHENDAAAAFADLF